MSFRANIVLWLIGLVIVPVSFAIVLLVLIFGQSTGVQSNMKPQQAMPVLIYVLTLLVFTGSLICGAAALTCRLRWFWRLILLPAAIVAPIILCMIATTLIGMVCVTLKVPPGAF